MLLAQQTLRKVIDEFHLYPDDRPEVRLLPTPSIRCARRPSSSRASIDTFAISFEGFDREQAQKVCARMADMLVAENAKRLQEENKGATEFLEAEKKRPDEELDRIEREISQFIQLHPEFATAKDGPRHEDLALKSKADEDRRSGACAPRRPGPRGGSGRTPPPVVGARRPGEDRAPAVDPVLISSRTQAYADAARGQEGPRREVGSASPSSTRTCAPRADRVAAAEAALRRAERRDRRGRSPRRSRLRPGRPASTEDPYGEPTAKPAGDDGGRDPPDPDGRPGRREGEAPAQGRRARPGEQGGHARDGVGARSRRSLAPGTRAPGGPGEQALQAEMVASTAESGYGTTIAVLDPAFKPSGPSNAPNRTVVMMGLAASIAVGLVLSAAWGLFLDDRLFSASEIEGSVMVPVLGVVPRDKRKEKPRRRAGPLGNRGASPVARAAGGASAPTSSFASLERTLDRTIECLVAAASRAVRRAPCSSRRAGCAASIANWRSIPPPSDVRDEMLERVLQLSTAVGAALPDSGEEVTTVGQPTPTAPSEESYDEEATAGYALDFEPRLYSLDTAPSPQAAPRPTTAAASAPPRAALAVDRPRTSVDRAPTSEEEPTQAWSNAALQPPPDLEPVASAPAPWPVEEPPRVAPIVSAHASAPPPAPAGRSPVVLGDALPARQSYPPVARSSALPPPPALAPVENVPADAPKIITYQLDGEGDDLSVPRTQIAAHTVKLADPVNPLLVVLTDPYSPRTDAYRTLRRKLAATPTARVLAVTSAQPGEGKTVFALNLALTLRESGRGRVLVVEANLRAPIMAKMLGFASPECFVAQLSRHAEDQRAPWVVAEPLPKLHVMAIDPEIPHEPLLDPVTFSMGMERLKQAGYEYIIVDSPPVLGSIDCNVISDAVDALILTALPMKSMRRQMRESGRAARAGAHPGRGGAGSVGGIAARALVSARRRRRRPDRTRTRARASRGARRAPCRR